MTVVEDNNKIFWLEQRAKRWLAEGKPLKEVYKETRLSLVWLEASQNVIFSSKLNYFNIWPKKEISCNGCK